MKLIDADSLIEHAEVNCESSDFVEKLIDYVAEQEEVSISQGHENDLISRRKALEAIDNMFSKSLAKTRAIDAINSVPSEHSEPERTMDEFMFGQDMGNPEDGSL